MRESYLVRPQLPRRKMLTRGLMFGVFLTLSVGWGIPEALKAEDLNYESLVKWIEQYRAAEPSFSPGQHLSEKNWEAIKPFIPQSAWTYYRFEGMDMEIDATHHYPFPKDWGKGLPADARLDENGVLVNFTGGATPFPEIKPNDPQAAVKEIWNMLWRPGTQDYVMPMVAWSRSKGGQLDRVFEFTSVSMEYARGEECLVPGYEEVRGKSLMEFRSPRDLAGAKNLSVAYVDHYKEDDGWLYDQLRGRAYPVLPTAPYSAPKGRVRQPRDCRER